MKEEALKLADELDKLHQYVPSDAPTMIRRLVEELDCANDYIKQYQLERRNEPVAWLKNGNVEWVQYPMDMSKPIPLYTAPQTKPLSDEEIRVEWAEGLIKQLPEDHEGRNSWLLNYGGGKDE